MNRLVPTLIASALLVLAGCSKTVRYPQGSEMGQCYGNGTCNGDLTCESNVCVQSGSGSNGGASGNGGSDESGGQSGGDDTGGASGTGGDDGTGGDPGSGGELGTGGSQESGGSEATGGDPASGGSEGSGGAPGAGGTTTTSTNACNASVGDHAVGFCNGLALGAMSGYGWVALGSADTLSDPTCDTANAPITEAAPCLANTNWNKTDALCMSGSIPALEATDPDYSGNWGVQLGVNAKDPNEGMGGSGWKTITITTSGSPSTGLRAVLHKYGDLDSTGYCVAMTSGTPLAITDFNSACWDQSGDSLTEADAGSIDKVGVQVTSTASAITVEDLCMTKIEFGN